MAKINSYFSLDFKTTLTKHQVTQVLISVYLKRHLFILNGMFLRELDRGGNDVKGSLV